MYIYIVLTYGNLKDDVSQARAEDFNDGTGYLQRPCEMTQVSDEIAIVGTLDFFTPIVDEPEA